MFLYLRSADGAEACSAAERPNRAGSSMRRSNDDRFFTWIGQRLSHAERSGLGHAHLPCILYIA